MLLSTAIVGYSGAIFKTVGDAFCAALDTAPEAVLAALAAQRALRDEPWSDEIGEIRVRMALQTGAAELRDGDYFGQPLNRVARLLSAGHGGQVLLALPTAELVRDTLPADATLLETGGGAYRGQADVGMAGRWDVTITVTRDGQVLGRVARALVAR